MAAGEYALLERFSPPGVRFPVEEASTCFSVIFSKKKTSSKLLVAYSRKTVGDRREPDVCMETCASPNDAWKKDVLWLFRDAAVIFGGHHSFRVVITLEPTTRAAPARPGLLLVRETPLRRLPCHLRAVPNCPAKPTCGPRFHRAVLLSFKVE